ncbi:MAG TPA: hypothetical protein VGE44_14065 [Daejeonella sp.]|uniref:hypothetical protein n=1 Tax=Daejeonella sp. TaxID=2805397 RepID=UPI002ED95BAD
MKTILQQMKFRFLVLIFIFLSVHSYAESIGLDEIRNIKVAVHRAIESSAVTDSLYLTLKSESNQSPLIVAYIGTLEALKAKHSWNPYNKIKYVSLSQKTMRKAVERDPNNLEIRFMRFTIQHYTPSFLGFSKDLDEDRKAIVRQFKNKKFGLADAPLIRNIAAFMIESDRCLKEELPVFKKYI